MQVNPVAKLQLWKYESILTTGQIRQTQHHGRINTKKKYRKILLRPDSVNFKTGIAASLVREIMGKGFSSQQIVAWHVFP
jgi:hypothetical protein